MKRQAIGCEKYLQNISDRRLVFRIDEGTQQKEGQLPSLKTGKRFEQTFY